MKCLKCGTELNDGVHFCSNCGEKLKEQSVQKNDSSGKKDSKNNTNKTQEKIITFWKKRSLFGKIATISLLLFALLGLIAFLAGRIFAGIISVVAIATVIVAILMKKQVIKVPKTWISLMVVILSFVLVFPYFSLFKINISDFARYNWNEIALSEMLPKPKSPYGETIYNSEESVSLYVTKTKITQYEDYINKCQDKGFTIENETKGNSFYAYNDKGYKLSLSYYEYNNEMHISLDSPMEMENITWPTSEMAKLLPIPESKLGKIYSDDENSYAVYIGNTTIDDYNTYVQACENKGFTIDAKKQEKRYTAKNAESYTLTVIYEGNNVVYIRIVEPIANLTKPTVTQYVSPEANVTPTPTVKPTAVPTPTVDPNKIAIPIFDTYTGTYNEAIDLLKKAGFTNIETKADYTLNTGFFGSLSLYDCDSISVNNQTSFSKGDLFDKNSKIIITYKDYKIKDPNIKYTAYTVSKLVEDLDSNAMNAKEKYLNQYVVLTGRVNHIDDNGDFSLYPSDNKYSFIYVTCNLELDEQKEQVKKLSKGDIISVKGKITLVGDILGYSLDVYAIQ